MTSRLEYGPLTQPVDQQWLDAFIADSLFVPRWWWEAAYRLVGFAALNPAARPTQQTVFAFAGDYDATMLA